MCGMDTVSYDDLKEHANVSGSSLWFQQVLSWFWVVVSSFTQEEMAKLLQFVTGCSQLPPGGFKELNPRFTITSAPTRNRLPTAHTWCVCVRVCVLKGDSLPDLTVAGKGSLLGLYFVTELASQISLATCLCGVFLELKWYHSNDL